VTARNVLEAVREDASTWAARCLLALADRASAPHLTAGIRCSPRHRDTDAAFVAAAALPRTWWRDCARVHGRARRPGSVHSPIFCCSRALRKRRGSFAPLLEWDAKRGRPDSISRLIDQRPGQPPAARVLGRIVRAKQKAARYFE